MNGFWIIVVLIVGCGDVGVMMYFVCWRVFAFVSVCFLLFVVCFFSGHVCPYYFVLCLVLRLSSRWYPVLSTTCFISWWKVLWSEDHFFDFCKKKIVFRLTLIIFIFFVIILEYMSKCFVIRRRTNHSFLYADSGGLLLMRSEYQKINTAGLEVEISARHDFWIFDVSFTKIKRIIITWLN